MVSQKPWQLDSVLKLGIRLLVCISAGVVASSVLRRALGENFFDDSMLNLAVAVLATQLSALVLVAFFLRKHSTSWSAAFGFNNKTGRAISLGVAVGLAAPPVMWGLQWLSVQTFSQLGFDVREQEAVRLLRAAAATDKKILLAVMAVGLAPLAEEFLFRGILYPFVKQCGFPRWALFGVAAFFALIHGNLVIFAPLVALAIALALLYEWTDNLLACIIVHAMFNAANFVMLFVLKNSGQL